MLDVLDGEESSNPEPNMGYPSRAKNMHITFVRSITMHAQGLRKHLNLCAVHMKQEIEYRVSAGHTLQEYSFLNSRNKNPEAHSVWIKPRLRNNHF